MKRLSVGSALLIVLAVVLATAPVEAYKMFSKSTTFKGAGTFYGPGNLPESPLFDVVIETITFASPTHMITPFFNNGGAAPNVCAQETFFKPPTGTLSDRVTRINENVNVCHWVLAGFPVLAAVVDGGVHAGEQLADLHEDGTMTMTMEFAFDLGEGRVMKLPFNATTGTLKIPPSLQTQRGQPGGIDQAGPYKTGDTITGRLGDYDNDGLIDGAVVVVGNIPLESPFFPGAPYALIRYFVTDMPAKGVLVGRLPQAK